MMKKLAVLLSLIMCVFLVGCFGPSQKEAATKMDEEIYQPVKPVFAEMINGIGNADSDSSRIQLVDEYVLQLEEIEKKTSEYKVHEDNKQLHQNILDQITSMKELLLTAKQASQAGGVDSQSAKQMRTALNNLADAKLHYDNELSMITTGKSAYELSLKNFQKIHKGMNYASVARTFNMPGHLTNSTETNSALTGHRLLEHYVWEHDGAKVRIMFENGKAHMMEQENLK